MKFVKNLSALLVSDALSKAVQFVVLGYLARTLGAEGLGTFIWVQSVLLIFGLFPQFGLNEYGIFKISPDRSPENISRITSDILGFRTITSLLGIGILVALSFAEPHFAEYRPLLLAGSPVLLTAIVSADWLFTALENQALIGLYRTVSRIVFMGAILVLVRSPGDVMPALACYVVGEGVFSVGLFLHARQRTSWTWIHVGIKRLKDVFIQAWPFAVLMANGSVLYYIDLFLIGVLLPMEEAGLYGGALRIVAPFISVKYLFGQLIYPKLARWTASPEDREELQKLTGTINRYGLLMGLVLASILVVFSRELVTLVLGPAFASAWWPFSLLSLALFGEFAWIAFPFLVVCLNARSYTWIVLTTTVLKVTALVVVIPAFGVVGGAVVYSAATLLIFVLSVHFVRRRLTPVAIVRLMVGPSALVAIMLTVGFLIESLWGRVGAWFLLIAASMIYLYVIGQRYSLASIKKDLHVINA